MQVLSSYAGIRVLVCLCIDYLLLLINFLAGKKTKAAQSDKKSFPPSELTIYQKMAVNAEECTALCEKIHYNNSSVIHIV
jgi:hypothetical protein